MAKRAVGTDAQIPRDACDPMAFVAKIVRFQPEWVALHCKGSASAILWKPGVRCVPNSQSVPAYGEEPFLIGGAQVFVLPSDSAANQRREYEGIPDRLEWFKELARLVALQRGPGP